MRLSTSAFRIITHVGRYTLGTRRFAQRDIFPPFTYRVRSFARARALRAIATLTRGASRDWLEARLVRRFYTSDWFPPAAHDAYVAKEQQPPADRMLPGPWPPISGTRRNSLWNLPFANRSSPLSCLYLSLIFPSLLSSPSVNWQRRSNVINAFRPRAADRPPLPTLFPDPRAISQKTYGESCENTEIPERGFVYTPSRRMMRSNLWSVQNRSFAASAVPISRIFLNALIVIVCHISGICWLCKYFKFFVVDMRIICCSL